MARIIFTDDLDFLKRDFVSKDPGRVKFIKLTETEGTLGIKAYLTGALRAEEITSACMSEKLGGRFKDSFSKTIRSVNKDNGSLFWWAMSFTDKTPMISSLYENTFCFIAIREIASSIGNADLVVLSDNKILAAQLKDWARKSNAGLSVHIHGARSLKDSLRDHTPLAITHNFLKLLFRKAVSNILLHDAAGKKDRKSIIVTLFEARSIDANGIYSDIYFGPMKDFLPPLSQDKKGSFTTIGFSPYFNLRDFTKFVMGLKSGKENENVYPMEYFLKFKDIFRLFALSLWKFLKPQRFSSYFVILGSDATILLNNEIWKSVSSGQLLMNLALHSSAASFSSRYAADALYYPFENRSWEKMLVLAFRKSSPGTKIIGYQHTVIAPQHLAFFLERDEYDEIPRPDRIVTDGEVTKGIMERWNFPKDRLVTGCALRYSAPRIAPTEKEGSFPIRNILVALSTSIEEYVKMLIFLDEAFAAGSAYNVVIRPHPALPFNDALARFEPKRFKYTLSLGTLKEDLASCDLVLYTSSTVSLEAMFLGKPVIHIGLDDFIDRDPIFDMDTLKWRCRRPQDLAGLIETIDKMSREEILEMRRGAALYANRYFYPVNKENLAKFLV